jgi:hypothetical protein
MTSLLWKRLTITVEFDDPVLAAELPEKARFSLADVVLTPTIHGVLLRRGHGHPTATTYRSSATLLRTIADCRALAEEQALGSGGSSTATGRYHLDRAGFWRAVERVVLEHKRWLWPAEAA